MKELIKKIAIRFVLILLIITIGNFIYRYTTFKSDIQTDGNVILKFEHAIEKADVIYFSASPNAAVHPNDTDTRTIAEMMNDLSELEIQAVDTGGIHAGIFKKLISIIPEKSKVKTVVVNMNYRSFGPGWIYSDLENAIQLQALFYSNYPVIIQRFLQGLNHYPVLTERERKEKIDEIWKKDVLPFAPPHQNVIDWCNEYKWGDWQNPKRQLADAYIKNFAFLLDEDNPRIQDFDEIVKICKEKKLHLIFILLPENLEEGQTLVGNDLISLMQSNRAYLLNRYNKEGVEVVDCFDKVPDSCFIERVFPTEHYTQSGRFTVASQLIKMLGK